MSVTVQVGSVRVPGRGVFGVGIIGEEAFVSQSNYNIISVYNITTYTKDRVISVDEMKEPSDLLACASNRCLYIPDEKGCIWKIPTHGVELPEQKVFFHYIPRALAMQSDKPQIIVTPKADKRVFICDLDCNVLLTLYLPGDTKEHQHIIDDPLTANTFILLHVPASCGRYMRRLIRCGDDNQLQFDDSCQDGDIELARPRHLARLEDGSIIVADFDNNRLAIINSELNRNSFEVLLDRDERSVQGMLVDRPCRLAYYPHTKRLAVSMHHNAVFYEIKPK